MPSLVKRAKGWRSRHTDFSGPPSCWRSCHTDFWARQVVGGAAIRIFGLAKLLAEPPYGFLGRSRHTDFWARQVVGGAAIRIFGLAKLLAELPYGFFRSAKLLAELPYGFLGPPSCWRSRHTDFWARQGVCRVAPRIGRPGFVPPKIIRTFGH